MSNSQKDINKDLKKENKAISSIGTTWKKRRSIYIALEKLNIDYDWSEREVIEIIGLINDYGGTVEELSRVYNRPPLDIKILAFDLFHQDLLKRVPSDF